jgi:hypothetical protein
MDWENERWIKIYTRDTGGWLNLSWQARGLALEISRKVDAAGRLPLGKRGLQSLAGVLRGRWDDMEPFIAELMADDRFVLLSDNVLLDPEHEGRQAARASSAVRKKVQRERAATSRDVTRSHATSRATTLPDTERDNSAKGKPEQNREAVSRDVTRSHATSRDVTIRVEEIRREETREDPPIPPEGVTPTPVLRVVGPDGDCGMLFSSWTDGIREATGIPQSGLSPSDRRELVNIANTHAGGVTGQALLDWVRSTAIAFAKVHDPTFGGFVPLQARKWLDGGKRSATRIKASQIVQSAEGRCWDDQGGF